MPYNFLVGNSGIPSWDERLAGLQADFGAAFAAASPDFQIKYGCEWAAPQRTHTHTAGPCAGCPPPAPHTAAALRFHVARLQPGTGACPALSHCSICFVSTADPSAAAGKANLSICSKQVGQLGMAAACWPATGAGAEAPAALPLPRPSSCRRLQVGERFNCLSFTLEQPFKDNADLPDPEQASRQPGGGGAGGRLAGGSKRMLRHRW